MDKLIVSAGEGTPVGPIGTIKLFGKDTSGSFSLVEHPIPPGHLMAPMHTHRNEDEYSFVLEGEVTVQIGDEVITAPAGTLVYKPRDVPHSFWNAGARLARVLEIISPAGFENYFVELAEVLATPTPPDFARIGALAQKYGLENDFSSLMGLSQKHNVYLGGQKQPAW